MKKASLLWVDLEMTGLDPKEDAILEVAAIATDYDFKPIATYEGVVKVDEKELANLLKKNGDFWNANPKARDGLIKQNASGKGSNNSQASSWRIIQCRPAIYKVWRVPCKNQARSCAGAFCAAAIVSCSLRLSSTRLEKASSWACTGSFLERGL